MMPGPVTLLIFGYLHVLFTYRLLLCSHAHSCLLLCLLPIASFSACCPLPPSLLVAYCLLLCLLPIASFSACRPLPPSLPAAYCLLLCLLPIASFSACCLLPPSMPVAYCPHLCLLPIASFSFCCLQAASLPPSLYGMVLSASTVAFSTSLLICLFFIFSCFSCLFTCRQLLCIFTLCLYCSAFYRFPSSLPFYCCLLFCLLPVACFSACLLFPPHCLLTCCHFCLLIFLFSFY